MLGKCGGNVEEVLYFADPSRFSIRLRKLIDEPTQRLQSLKAVKELS
jgi:hypothetical protein